MAHFMKGFGAGLGGFALWYAFVAMIQDFLSPGNDAIIYLLFMLGSPIVLIGGPVYYWILYGFIHKEPTDRPPTELTP